MEGGDVLEPPQMGSIWIIDFSQGYLVGLTIPIPGLAGLPGLPTLPSNLNSGADGAGFGFADACAPA